MSGLAARVALIAAVIASAIQTETRRAAEMAPCATCSTASILPLAPEVPGARGPGGVGYDQAAADADASIEERLWQHRNLGKAFYENPTTRAEAVEELRKALALRPESARERLNVGLALLRAGKIDEGVRELEQVQRQDPSLPHTWFNLGIQYKKRNTPEATEKAIAQFERMVALDPREAISQHNLGSLYKAAGRLAEAVERFEAAVRLDPNLAGPQFQLYNAYRDPRIGRTDDAARALARFQALKKQQAGAVIPEDLDWSVYAELYDPADAAGEPADPPPAPPVLRGREVLRAADIDPQTAGLAAIAVDADTRPDLLVWSSKGIRLLLGGETPAGETGLEAVTDVRFVAPGDFDNDGAIDLAVVTGTGASLWRNTGARAFARQPAALPDGTYARAFWLDYDRDYDFDLLLLGPRSALLRNAGAAGFSDATADFPFQQGTPTDVVQFEAVADTLGHDVIVSYADRAGVLYRDRLAGKYEAVTIEALPAGTRALLARDFNRDGWIDVAAGSSDAAILLLNRSAQAGAAQPNTLQPIALPRVPGTALASADFENRGVADLIAGSRLLRWTTSGVRDVALDAESGVDAIARATADFDEDGRLDLASIDRTGNVRLARNAATDAHRWLRVSLTGVKNVKAAVPAEVEVKAGARYQKALYQGVPLLFGLGDRTTIDTVRITWPNGLVQNEPRQTPGRTAAIKEAPRLSGSCPMIFTWDGTRFRFITDVLGVAPLGASAGDGTYFPVDRDEYVHLPGDALAPVDGRFDVRVTEELREVTYLDRIQLLALDYPATHTIVTNDKFKAPPFPEFRLFGVDTPVPPVSARDHHGRDVRDRILRLDATYADSFTRDFEGVAEQHALELDFGHAAADNRALLVLTGWVDWADGSTFRGAAQEDPTGLILPYLQVKDAQGRWQTVIEDMGLPAGKTKTIAVDLTHAFRSASRQIRIVTNLCVYWDRIYLSERTAPPPDVVLTPLAMPSAELRFHGFSRPVIHPERKQPERFEYEHVRPFSMWSQTPGLYTRYGDVASLLSAADDRLVVMGSGDELRLRFDPQAAPPLRAGWRRDYLLLFEGWAKDGDANTAFSQTVDPLPFRAMSAYPYGPSEHYPRADEARAYNTRPALRLIRPLAAAPSRASTTRTHAAASDRPVTTGATGAAKGGAR